MSTQSSAKKSSGPQRILLSPEAHLEVCSGMDWILDKRCNEKWRGMEVIIMNDRNSKTHVKLLTALHKTKFARDEKGG